MLEEEIKQPKQPKKSPYPESEGNTVGKTNNKSSIKNELSILRMIT